MTLFIRFILGLAFTALAIVLATADKATLAALGLILGFIFCGLLAIGLVLAGQVTPADLNEANGLNHPDGLEGKN